MKPPGPSEWGTAAAELGQVVKSVTTGKFLQQTTKVSSTACKILLYRYRLFTCLGV